MRDHVVTMSAAGRGLQVRRAIQVRYPEIAKIVCNTYGIVEGELFVELKPIRRNRGTGHGEVQSSKLSLILRLRLIS
jgi:hypothetical protein